ncbi:RNA polymerase sigma factor [Herminiimonas glaciei]|uniref:RNA polymerase sigma factor n=1 Tax=Herminiimonas glaciei TaxID=523788 RepID=A0ABW2I8E7_9BURK
MPSSSVAIHSFPAQKLQDYLLANYSHLHKRLTRHLACPDQASDCLHDAWLRLGEMPVTEEVKNLEAYVYRVACNLAIDNVRSSRPWQYVVGLEDAMEYIADDAARPDQIAELRSELQAVDRALHGLPRHHHDILLCLRLEELTRQEVALRHGISVRSVDTMLRQALDYCAEQTGQLVMGGVSSPRRCLPRHRESKARAAMSAAF